MYNLEKFRSEYIQLKNEYIGKYDSLEDNVKHKESYREYAIGGEVIHRGCYCPSPVQDIIIGRNNRGRLLKKFNNKYSYEYIFDKDNKLLKSIQRGYGTDLGQEYIVYKKDATFSINFNVFNNEKELNYISKCNYEESKIVKYEFVVFGFEESLLTFTIEEYEYDNNDLLKKVDFYYSAYAADINNVKIVHLRYFFNRDSEGYMTTFTGGEVKNNVIQDEHTCDIKIKRK